MGKYLVPFILLFIISCAPTQVQTKEPFVAQFDKTPEYHIDLDNITKPKKLVPIYVDSSFNQVENANEATYILLDTSEYSKIPALLKLCVAYKDIIKEQEGMINNNIDISNSLKEYIVLEQSKTSEYRNLWIDSENSYRQERYNHKMDNNINRGIFGVIFLGTIIAAIAL